MHPAPKAFTTLRLSTVIGSARRPRKTSRRRASSFWAPSDTKEHAPEDLRRAFLKAFELYAANPSRGGVDEVMLRGVNYNLGQLCNLLWSCVDVPDRWLIDQIANLDHNPRRWNRGHVTYSTIARVTHGWVVL